MKTWILLAFMAALFSVFGVLMTVLAFVTGEWALLGGLVFLTVGLVMAWFVPATRREQNADRSELPAAVNAVLKETGWYSSFWTALPAESKGALIVGAIGGGGAVVGGRARCRGNSGEVRLNSLGPG